MSRRFNLNEVKIGKEEITDKNCYKWLMAFEEGELSDAEILKLFSYLIKTGLAYKLQGMYGRYARDLISYGFLTSRGEITKLGKEIIRKGGLSESMKFLKEEDIPTNLTEPTLDTSNSCSNCMYYDRVKNWCKNATYVIASAGGFMLYTWLANPLEPNRCPIFKEKSETETE